MPNHLGRSLVFFALAASLTACGDGGAARPTGAKTVTAAQRAVDYGLYWVGPSFAGLTLTDVSHDGDLTTLVYGSCTPQPAGDEASCSPPLEIQVASICDRNPLILDIRPRARFRSVRTVVFDYGDNRLELSAGDAEVVVWAAPRTARRAIAALRPVGSRHAALPPPRYPRSYVTRLSRVSDAFARTGRLRAVRDELRISKSAVRFELQLARDLSSADARGARTRC
jgi:hypothetical protein